MGNHRQTRGKMNMNWQGLKKGIAGAMLAVTLLLGSGAILGTTAQAQNRDRDWRRDNRRDNNRDWNRDGRRDRDWDRNRDRNRDWERRRAEERARAIQRARELEWRRQQELARRRNNGYYGYGYPRNYPNGGYIGGGRSYGYNSYEEQKGFRDGLDRGQEDLRDRRRPDPNNSDHYRSGNAAYREGFRRGYAQGYRSYGRW